jgi:hypothetical protein
VVSGFGDSSHNGPMQLFLALRPYRGEKYHYFCGRNNPWMYLFPQGVITVQKMQPMKKLFALFALVLMVTLSYAQDATLTVTFKFIGIVDGYDHTCKTQVWVNGEMAGESKEVVESKGTTFTVKVPSGSQDLRVINLALYEGAWEEHTISNEYSIDCLWEGQRTLKAKNKLFMLHDIDSQTYVSWKKMPKAKKKKG